MLTLPESNRFHGRLRRCLRRASAIDNQFSERPNFNRKGLTLIELLVCVVVIGILMAVLIPTVMRARETARRAECLQHLRNLTLAIIQFDQLHSRLPAAGYFHDPSDTDGQAPVEPHHSWAVLLLPHIAQQPLYDRWDLNQPLDSPDNLPLADSYVRVFSCPSDISTGRTGDLSYALNGGWGFTTRTDHNVGDCPVDRSQLPLDLNGDQSACSGDSQLDNLDRVRFKQLGLFFVENWKLGQEVSNRDFTRRFHSLPDIVDGLTTTMLITENARTGFDPDDPLARFANPHPTRTMFFIGNPCLDGECSDGQVDYSLANAGEDRINSGLDQPEGTSTAPNSFHSGGVNMAFADGHILFLSEQITGEVYAALASPQGQLVRETPLTQTVVSGSEF